jgi:hypothetical protein
MQHKILFIRHNRLAWKYENYNTLSFSELRELWLNMGIYTIIRDNISSSLNTSWYQKCFTSSQIRTIETAELLWYSQVENRKFLDEIYFDLAELMTEEEYILWGWLPSVRIALWKSFFERRKWVETPELVMKKIRLLLSELENTSERDIIVVTHGFFLQMVRCFLGEWVDFTKISYDDFLKLDIKPIWYLEGFEIQR